MKTKLLRKLRYTGMHQIDIISVTETNGKTSGMSYSHDGTYRGLFNPGDTEFDVRYKAFKIWYHRNIEYLRRKYKKHSKKSNLDT